MDPGVRAGGIVDRGPVPVGDTGDPELRTGSFRDGDGNRAALGSEVGARASPARPPAGRPGARP